ncbi:MAG: Gfo/Idh/MocA family oxidoreductase [Actinomycetes bacterium]
MSALRWGFLSAGGIATAVADDFRIAGINIQAVGARDLAKANEFADKFGIPNRHQGYEALVNDPEVDAVYISTPHPWHHQHALLALNAGKHVLLEKPFTINAREAQEIKELAAAKKLFVLEAMWTRFLPSMDAIFAVINSGILGDIRLVTADHSQYLPHVARLWEPELGGGALLDLGIYPVSFAVRVLGLPKQVIAKTTLTGQHVDETTSLIFEYESGAQASLTTCMSAAGPVTATVVGTFGRIEIDTPFYNQTSFKVFNQGGEVIQSYDEKIKGVGRQYQGLHLEKCVAAGLLESPVLSVTESVEIMKVMDALRAQMGVKYPTE